ncbi:MAG TPA: hypothetical protein VHV51_06250 [Polyangiaceae bacterium]|jgi:SAM-dependent methyltransferase|nr:hypothetical protein [Polyangiaceae bacterium]
MNDSSLLEPSIALAAYAEPLAENRRVLVFGSALGALAFQLLERGARSVHVCDPDPVRVAEATARNRSTQISFSALADSDLAVRDGAFELGLIENLGAFNALSILKKVHRALVPRGVAIVACPNPEASTPLLQASSPSDTVLDYYALYDAVAAEFEQVRMLGQTPFVGYAIADFSASGEPEPALDTSFVPGGAEEPDLFLALASNQDARLDQFAVIQLPTRRLLASLAQPPKKQEPSASAKVDARELARLKTWAGELEARASTADERADGAEAEVEELRAKLETEEKTRAAFEARHEQELAALRAKLAERERELAEHTSEDNKSELAAFERQLSERGAEVRRLEDELRTAERTGKELVRELERRRTEQAAAANAELERALAEREADLQAAAWTIESLSLRLELAGKPGASVDQPETAAPNAEAR